MSNGTQKAPLPSDHHGKPEGRRRRRAKQINNPLQAGICKFLQVHYLARSDVEPARKELCETLIGDPSTLPKRYNIYHPLLLLPSNFLPIRSSSSPVTPRTLEQTAWHNVAGGLTDEDLLRLWQALLSTFHKDGITHIAIGAPIELELPDDGQLLGERRDNVLRSPTGIIGVYGDFGVTPSDGSGHPMSSAAGEQDDQNTLPPFDSALWVQATQNGGILQVWAPMWTMFSRGNIKEKARILNGTQPSNSASTTKGAAAPSAVCHGLDGLTGTLSQPLSQIAVVDMYVGIGYFAFSYLKRGVGRVIGFDLNAWSIEGLRRGAERNGWRCEVLHLPPFPEKDPIATDEAVGPLGTMEARKLLHCIHDPEIRLVACHGDNRWATSITAALRDFEHPESRMPLPLATQQPPWKDIRHINLGLLPTSSGSWADAEQLLSDVRGGWIHVHENVEIEKIERKAHEIVTCFEGLVKARRERRSGREGSWTVECVHVERVKTYAPGIMHCVFDIWVRKEEL